MKMGRDSMIAMAGQDGVGCEARWVRLGLRFPRFSMKNLSLISWHVVTERLIVSVILLGVLGLMGCCSRSPYANILGDHDFITLFAKATNKADVLTIFETYFGADAESLEFQNACMENTDRLLLVKFGGGTTDPIPVVTLRFIFDSSGELTTIGRAFIDEHGEVVSETQFYLPKFRRLYSMSPEN